MSRNADDHLIKDALEQLRCHFTWQLFIDDAEIRELESSISEEVQLQPEYSEGLHNLLGYMQHLQGRNDDALDSLNNARESLKREHIDQSDVRCLVTWGNYAWVYYHMRRWEDTQKHLDKVQEICNRFEDSSRYRVECPEMDCVEGWALLKCGRKNYERAKACFQKALEVDPENPEFNKGYAIAAYRLDHAAKELNNISEAFSLPPLRKAISLNPQDGYLKALLALKLQDVGKAAEGEEHLKKAVTHGSSQTYVFRYAAKFYRRQRRPNEALRYLEEALNATPNSASLHHQMGLCYRDQMIQIKNSTNWQPQDQSRRDVDRLIQLAIDKFQTATTLKPTFEMAYVDLAKMYAEIGQYEEAEELFQIALSIRNIEDHILQDIHYHYGQFQQYHRKSDDRAITQYLTGLRIEKMSYAREKLLKALQKVAERWDRQEVRVVEAKSLLGLIHKLRGELMEALLCYEEALRLAADLNAMF
ncbi:interferon-induced protein with tetratricopeptide repeats 1B-like [Ochotona curzoniae]|uniref:interferon-induced protein with tetratricopeptide repeats 1B-like n=1 Tax=Ochotona curzoniae TaxID=130825 RepID=UPI001B34B69A|nr:interferon-induced protein with tetratricopeptide repeats 1B-like [Ochotona curzoniae]